MDKLFSNFKGRKYIGAKRPIRSLVRIITDNIIGEIDYRKIADHPVLEECAILE